MLYMLSVVSVYAVFVSLYSTPRFLYAPIFSIFLYYIIIILIIIIIIIIIKNK